MSNKKYESVLSKNMKKYVDFASWVIWYPDLFLDLVKPKTGGIHLHSDERLFLRIATRFASMYGCFPRGWGKTTLEVLAFFIVAIRYPNIQLSVSAQTKTSSSNILKDKYKDIVRMYPMFENEIIKTRFSRDEAEIIFRNEARIDNLANSQNAKGQRRHRINMEESALMDAVTFEDALKPIVEVSRYTCGKLALVNPEELNQYISFFTTPAWKGSDEYVRNLRMIKNMVNLKGDFVLGANWMLACWYGRGSTKSQILQKKKDMTTIAFDQNYGGRWTGSSNNALVNVNRLLDCRKLTKPITELENSDDEFYMAVDVARSQKTSNNQSSVVIGKVIRNPNTLRINNIDICNVLNISNTLNFTDQAVIIKKLAERYKVKKVVVDGNGLGAGLVDELLKDTVDPMSGAHLGCWDTINTDNEPETNNADKIVYDLKAQSAQTKIISTFIDMVDSKKLRLLVKKQDSEFTADDREDFGNRILPYIQTDLLFEEVSNLKLKHLSNGGLTVEKVVAKLNKDRFSALSYLLWYINEYEGQLKTQDDFEDIMEVFRVRTPKVKGRRSHARR